MSYNIPFFRDAKVGDETRRLAFCFNVAAENSRESGENALVIKAIELYEETTGQKTLPCLNDDEAGYLRLQLLQVAAKLNGDRNFGWAGYVETLFEAVGKIEKAAAKKGLSLKPDEGIL